MMLSFGLCQRFSTWGTRTLRGTREDHTGYAKFKKCSKEALLDRSFDLGVRKGHTILIWGYSEGFDLGLQSYQKVENPWFM